MVFHSLDLVNEDLGGRPRDTGVVGVNTVNEESTTSGDVVDSVVCDLLNTSALDDNVETVYGLVCDVDMHQRSSLHGLSFLI